MTSRFAISEYLSEHEKERIAQLWEPWYDWEPLADALGAFDGAPSAEEVAQLIVGRCPGLKKELPAIIAAAANFIDWFRAERALITKYEVLCAIGYRVRIRQRIAVRV